jgi:hypothetical protein
MACSSCQPNGPYPFLHHDHCVATCPDGFHPSEATGGSSQQALLTCKACHDECTAQGCHGSGPGGCRVCRRLQLVSGTCVATCPKGTSPDDTGSCFDILMSPVSHFLTAIGLPEHIQRFHAEQISLSVVVDLTADELKELGVILLGHRKKILREIREHFAKTREKTRALLVDFVKPHDQSARPKATDEPCPFHNRQTFAGYFTSAKGYVDLVDACAKRPPDCKAAAKGLRTLALRFHPDRCVNALPSLCDPTLVVEMASVLMAKRIAAYNSRCRRQHTTDEL